MTDKINALLAEREATHGDFRAVAQTAQILKDVLRTAPSFDRMEHVQREAVEAICGKLARIACGNAFSAEHWEDVAGYARLVENWLAGLRVEAEVAEAIAQAASRVEVGADVAAG